MAERLAKKWQELALRYLQSRIDKGYKGASLWMEMRLGKSWTALFFLLRILGMKKILVLCPSKPILGWLYECEDMGVTSQAVVGPKPRRKKRLASDYSVAVTTYDTAIADDLLNPDVARWDAVILDESFLLAYPKSSRTYYACNTRGNEFRIALSGNPGAEIPLNLVSQYIACDGQILGCTTAWGFYEKFTHFDRDRKVQTNEGVDDLIRQWMREHSYCLTREQAGLQGGKNYGRIFVEMPPDLRSLHNAVAEDRRFLRKWNVNGEKITIDPRERANWLHQICSGILPGTRAKVQYTHKIEGLVSELSAQSIHKAVIMGVWLHELGLLAEHLRAAGKEVRLLTGESTMEQQAEAEAWLRATASGYLIAQEIAYKMGCKFSAADVLIYISNAVSGDARAQSEDRCINMDKTYNVDIIDVVCRGGADGFIATRVRDKTFRAKDLVAQGGMDLKEIEEWKA